MNPEKMGDFPRARVLWSSIVGVILLGIFSRLIETGLPVFDKYTGDALYAILGYLLLSCVWTTGKPRVKAGIIVVLTIIIETFQLTGIGLQLSQSRHPALKLLAIVLGTTFGWWDIAAYIIGTAVITYVDEWLTKRMPVSQ